MGANGPLMVNRIELQTILPTGEYDNDKLLNPGSNHYSFNPYWAATVFLAPKLPCPGDCTTYGMARTMISLPDSVDLEPGDAVHANFTAAYEVLPKQLRLGINGYWFDQTTDTKVAGEKVPSMSEKVFAIGPGAVWHFSQDTHLFVNAYFETVAESRPEGERYNLRLFTTSKAGDIAGVIKATRLRVAFFPDLRPIRCFYFILELSESF